jgi:hypothetical protein
MKTVSDITSGKIDYDVNFNNDRNFGAGNWIDNRKAWEGIDKVFSEIAMLFSVSAVLAFGITYTITYTWTGVTLGTEVTLGTALLYTVVPLAISVVGTAVIFAIIIKYLL